MHSLARVFLFIVTFAVALAAGAQTRIKVGHTGTPEFLGAFVAKEQGFFAKHALDVEFQQIATANAINSIIASQLDLAAVTPPSLLVAVDSGVDLRAVAGTTVISHKINTFGMVVRSGSGIAAPKDLVGKKVGVPSLGAFFHVLARHWLDANGVNPRTVTFVEVAFPQMADVLKGGSVDAIVTSEPFLTRTVRAGAGSLLAYFTSQLPEGTSGLYYVAMGDWVKKNQAAAKAFRAAVAEGAAFAEARPDVARGYLAKYSPLPAEMLAAIQLNPLNADVTEQQLSFWVEVLRKQSMLKNPPDIRRLLAN